MTVIARNYLVILVGALLAVLLSACGSGNTTLNSSANPSVFYAHSVALQGNTVFAWGANTYGQVGNGDTKGATQFVPVPVITGMNGVSAGGTHTLAFINGGSVFAWGNNGLGQLGNNSTSATATPVQVIDSTTGAALTGVSGVSAGFNHSLAYRSSDGTVWAWGSNSEGQLGGDPAAIVSSAAAKQVPGLTTVTKIAAGGAHSIALSGGQAMSWGSNTEGQLGSNSAASYIITPTAVVQPNGTPPPTSFKNIAAGGSHSLFLDNNGAVWACGNNEFGQLGDETGTNRAGVVPVLLNGSQLTGVIAIAAGLDHSLALMQNGTVYAWGYNFYGQLGNGVDFTQPANWSQTTPVQVQKSDGTFLTGVTQIVAIGHHNLAVDSSGGIWAWGDNGYGELGIAVGDSTIRPRATQVTTSTGLIAPVLYSP